MRMRVEVVGSHVVLPKPHPSQRKVIASKARTRVICAGRRWGKTFVASIIAFDEMLRGGRVWWLTPSHDVGGEGWIYLHEMTQSMASSLRRQGIDPAGVLKTRKANHSRLIAYQPTGGRIEWRTAGGNPERLNQTLRGPGLNLLVIDEAAMIPDEVYEVILLPALMDHGGREVIMSTPKGRNWFYRLVHSKSQDVEVFRFTTYDNPHISAQEIERVKAKVPHHVFRQEILAEFIESHNVFVVADDVIYDAPGEAPDPEAIYSMGVDWGHIKDYTGVVVLRWTDDEQARVVKAERVTASSLTEQVEIVWNIYQEYLPYVVISEGNLIGIAPSERLAEMGAPVEMFKTTLQSKSQIIDNLARMMEQNKIELPKNEDLLSELESYTIHSRPGGGFYYGAPRGGHDDLVMALALAASSNVQKPEIDWIKESLA